MTNHEIFLARATEARADAESAALANVRDRCLRSAAAWEDMAHRAMRTDRLRAKAEAEKAERALAAAALEA